MEKCQLLPPPPKKKKNCQSKHECRKHKPYGVLDPSTVVLFRPVEPTEPHRSEKPVRPSLNKHEPQQTRENQAITDWKSCVISKKESRTMVEEKAKPWEMSRKGGGRNGKDEKDGREWKEGEA
ncbi:hypothetical protein GOBAR_DD32690 [Gossypium barbadense]|nr:hypothetical protein GOBAR_DD32690 [Gossypium barbadense]